MSTRMSSPAAPTSGFAPQKPMYELAGPQVDISGVRPALLTFVDYLGLVHRVVFLKALVITSGRDGLHSAGSKHGQGDAVDIRTKDLLPDEQGLLLALLAYAAPANQVAVFDERALGAEAHIHLEWAGA